MRRSNGLSQLRGWKAAHQIRSGNDLETRAGHSQQPEQPQRHKGRFVLVINSFIGPRENPFAEVALVMDMPGRA